MKEKHVDFQLEQLRRHAPNFTEDKILKRLVKSPDDFERSNPHMIHGAFHGGDRGLSQSGALRPVPGWGQYRMPIPGLYQTGGTTHPGGSVTGAPGRNAAMVLLQDLGTSLEQVLQGPVAGVRQ
jgi:phytoene dehydrogenase-like protein